MQRRSRAVDSDGMARASVILYCALERRHCRSLRQKVRAQYRDDRFHIRGGDILSPVGDHARALRLNSEISAVLKNTRLVPELYSKPGATGCPCSPIVFIV